MHKSQNLEPKFLCRVWNQNYRNAHKSEFETKIAKICKSAEFGTKLQKWTKIQDEKQKKKGLQKYKSTESGIKIAEPRKQAETQKLAFPKTNPKWPAHYSNNFTT